MRPTTILLSLLFLETVVCSYSSRKLAVDYVNSEGFSLSWNASNSNVRQFVATISPLTDSETSVFQKNVTSSAVVWNGLVAGKKYTTEIFSINYDGTIKHFASVNVTTVPLPPFDARVSEFVNPILSEYDPGVNQTLAYAVYGAVVWWDGPEVGVFDNFNVTVSPSDGEIRLPMELQGGMPTGNPKKKQRIVWDLTPGIYYEFSIRSVSNNQMSEPIVIGERMPPEIPCPIKVLAISPTSATLSWEHRRHRGIIDGYVVEIDPHGSREINPEHAEEKGRRIIDLTPGTVYSVDVYSTSFGVISTQPRSKNIKTPPHPPTGPFNTVNVTSNSLVVTWSKPTGNVEFFEVVFFPTNDDRYRLRHRTYSPSVRLTSLKSNTEYTLIFYSVSNRIHSRSISGKVRTGSEIEKESVTQRLEIIQRTVQDSNNAEVYFGIPPLGKEADPGIEATPFKPAFTGGMTNENTEALEIRKNTFASTRTSNTTKETQFQKLPTSGYENASRKKITTTTVFNKIIGSTDVDKPNRIPFKTLEILKKELEMSTYPSTIQRIFKSTMPQKFSSSFTEKNIDNNTNFLTTSSVLSQETNKFTQPRHITAPYYPRNTKNISPAITSTSFNSNTSQNTNNYNPISTSSTPKQRNSSFSTLFYYSKQYIKASTTAALQKTISSFSSSAGISIKDRKSTFKPQNTLPSSTVNPLKKNNNISMPVKSKTFLVNFSTTTKSKTELTPLSYFTSSKTPNTYSSTLKTTETTLSENFKSYTNKDITGISSFTTSKPFVSNQAQYEKIVKTTPKQSTTIKSIVRNQTSVKHSEASVKNQAGMSMSISFSTTPKATVDVTKPNEHHASSGFVNSYKATSKKPKSSSTKFFTKTMSTNAMDFIHTKHQSFKFTTVPENITTTSVKADFSLTQNSTESINPTPSSGYMNKSFTTDFPMSKSLIQQHILTTQSPRIYSTSSQSINELVPLTNTEQPKHFSSTRIIRTDSLEETPFYDTTTSEKLPVSNAEINYDHTRTTQQPNTENITFQQLPTPNNVAGDSTNFAANTLTSHKTTSSSRRVTTKREFSMFKTESKSTPNTQVLTKAIVNASNNNKWLTPTKSSFEPTTPQYKQTYKSFQDLETNSSYSTLQSQLLTKQIKERKNPVPSVASTSYVSPTLTAFKKTAFSETFSSKTLTLSEQTFPLFSTNIASSFYTNANTADVKTQEQNATQIHLEATSSIYETNITKYPTTQSSETDKNLSQFTVTKLSTNFHLINTTSQFENYASTSRSENFIKTKYSAIPTVISNVGSTPTEASIPSVVTNTYDGNFRSFSKTFATDMNNADGDITVEPLLITNGQINLHPSTYGNFGSFETSTEPLDPDDVPLIRTSTLFFASTPVNNHSTLENLEVSSATATNIKETLKKKEKVITIKEGLTSICKPNNITFLIDKNVIGEYETKYGPLYMNKEDKNCIGVEHATYYRYTIAPNILDCGTRIELNETHVNFTTSISNTLNRTRMFQALLESAANGDQNANSISWKFIHIRAWCSFPIDMNVSTLFPFLPQLAIQVVNFDVSGIGKFSAVMQLYKTSAYKEAYISPPTIGITGTLNVGITLLEAVDNSTFAVVKRCWGTPYRSPDGPNFYPLVENGCPSDKALNGSVRVLENGRSRRARWEGTVFKFVRYDEVWLHCEVQVCFGDDCLQSCEGSRKRRFSSFMTKESDFHVISAGPIALNFRKSNETLSAATWQPFTNNAGSSDASSKESAFLILVVALFLFVACSCVVISCALVRLLRRRSREKTHEPSTVRRDCLASPSFDKSFSSSHSGSDFVFFPSSSEKKQTTEQNQKSARQRCNETRTSSDPPSPVFYQVSDSQDSGRGPHQEVIFYQTSPFEGDKASTNQFYFEKKLSTVMPVGADRMYESAPTNQDVGLN